MARNLDLNSSISAAQKEVDTWERRALLAGNARPAGSRWPLTLVIWVVLALAVYEERDLFASLIAPHDISETIEQLGEILRHTADDIEAYRSTYGSLPDGLPIDFLNGIVTYTRDGSTYVLETSYHDSLVRLRSDASGPGRVEVLPR